MFVPRCSFVFSASIFNLLVLLFHEMRDYIIVLRTRERGLDADYTCMKKTFCLSLCIVYRSVLNPGVHVRVLSDKPLSHVHVHNNQALLYVLYSQGTALHDYRMTTPSYTTIDHHIPRITC